MHDMDQIAVISDLHGNLEAIKAVAADIRERNIQKIICLGDIIAKGTHQEECIAWVKENCDIVIKGNCDEYFAGEVDIDSKPELEAARIRWTKSKISKETVRYIEGLPSCYECYLSGRLVRFFHAHPQKIDGFVGNIDLLENMYELFLPGVHSISDEKADVVVYGHIHMPYIQKIYNRVIINTGAVGNSIDIYRNEEKDGDVRNTAVANYAVLKGSLGSMDWNRNISYELISVPYDLEKELKENGDNLEMESYQEEIRYGRYRDMKKVYDRMVKRGIDIKKL